MAIYRLLQGSALEPEQIRLLTEAFEISLRKLSITDRQAPITQVLAAKIITVGQIGESDPQIISDRAINALNLPFHDETDANKRAGS